MREHEVPTHVQAEDRVLLWFTFPQVVAMMAVCALSYGAYRYAPVGPSEMRMAIAVLLGLAGLVAVVGKIGGRRLPLVAADLLKYRLGARLYAGPPSELVRSEPPAPAQPVKSLPSRQAGGPGPQRLMARRAGKTLRRLRRKRGSRERTGGRMPFRPHRWFGKPRWTDKDNINGNGNGDGSRKSRQSKPPKSFLAIAAAVALAAAVAVPQAALANDHWRDEIDFEVTELVEGRRLFVEGLTVSGDRASVTLRAATALDIRVRAFGGLEGTWLRFWGSASLDEGERIDYSLPWTARTRPSPSRGRTRWGRPGPSPSKADRSRTPFRPSTGSSATCGSSPWAGVRGPSREPSPPSAYPPSRRGWSFRRWPDTPASPRRR